MLNNILIVMVLLVMLAMAMIMTSKMFSLKFNSNSSFECGFNQKTTSMMPFSSQFFLISILFLVFDLEIALFLPFILAEDAKMSVTVLIMMMMIFLSTGLIFEWNEGAVSWTK